MPHLFEPLILRSITLRNRIGVSPMCEYSSDDGFFNDWHLVHLGARAVGGAGLVMTEATAVEERGRISPHDAGIWKDEHIEFLARVTSFIKQHGAVPGIQLAHAGRKASTSVPWLGDGTVELENGGWEPVAPSSVKFQDSYPLPREMTKGEIGDVQDAFRAATRRAHQAGFQWVEIHGAHGYLAHQFLSPLSNFREDEYGGSFENRIRFLTETVQVVRAEWPQELPLAVRLSCTDWVPGGWDADQTVELSKRLKSLGADMVDCSTGGLSPLQQIPVGAGIKSRFLSKSDTARRFRLPRSA